MSAPTDRRYLQTHEWHKQQGDTVTIGITQFAADELTDITFIDLPKVGAKLQANQRFGEIESVKAVSSLYSPVSGEVLEANKDLPDNLEWLAQEPFGKAWMIKVKVTSKSPDLMTAAAYDAHCQAEG